MERLSMAEREIEAHRAVSLEFLKDYGLCL